MKIGKAIVYFYYSGTPVDSQQESNKLNFKLLAVWLYGSVGWSQSL